MIQTFSRRATWHRLWNGREPPTHERRRHELAAGIGRIGAAARHLVALLATVASALPGCREPGTRGSSSRAELCELMNAREVELRDGPAMPRPPESDDVARRRRAATSTLGAIDAMFDEGSCAFDEWDQQLLESARQLAALVMIIDRAQRGGGLGAGGRGVSQPMGRRRSWDPARRSARAGADGARRRDRIHRSDRRRERRRQGAGRAPDSRALAAARGARSWRSTAPRSSRRCSRPSCSGSRSASPPACAAGCGKFEHAHGGTLFLDEVADLSPAAQAKLLRAIQEMSVERVGGTGRRRVDTRIIAATNQSLSELVARGRFRLDLFYRLHGVEIVVPPLRERTEDILELAEYFLERHREFRRLRLSQAASDALLAYRWPGNVRELERVIERAVALARFGSPAARRPAAGAARRLHAACCCRRSAQFDSMRTWGSRYARMVFERCEQQQAADVPRAGDFLSHAERISPVPSRTTWPGCLRPSRQAQAGRMIRRGARRSLSLEECHGEEDAVAAVVLVGVRRGAAPGAGRLRRRRCGLLWARPRRSTTSGTAARRGSIASSISPSAFASS